MYAHISVQSPAEKPEDPEAKLISAVLGPLHWSFLELN